MDNLTMIQLTPEDAALFIQFQKRYAFMNLMESLGAFKIKSGYVTVHFDNMGEVGSIDVQQHYRLP